MNGPTGHVVYLPEPRAVRIKQQSLQLRRAVALIEGVAKDHEEGDPDIFGHLALAMAAALDGNSVLLEAIR